MNFEMFQPSPVLLGFIFVKKFLYLQVLGLLAVPRLVLARGAAQALALAVVCIGVAATYVAFAPALGANSGRAYSLGAQVLAMAGGMLVPLVASALLALSAALPNRRAGWIDRLHLVALAGLIGLWVASLY